MVDRKLMVLIRISKAYNLTSGAKRVILESEFGLVHITLNSEPAYRSAEHFARHHVMVPFEDMLVSF